jgi:hypothetical protein
VHVVMTCTLHEVKSVFNDTVRQRAVAVRCVIRRLYDSNSILVLGRVTC